MKNRMLLVTALVAASFALPGTAAAQITIDVHFDAPPPLVIVSPGIQVVEDHDDEIFFVDGWYWCRRGDRWYQTRDHKGGWVVIEVGRVPGTLVKIPPGQYKRYKHVKKEIKEDIKEHKQEHKEDKGKGKSKGKGK